MNTTRRFFLQLLCGALGVRALPKPSERVKTYALPILEPTGVVSYGDGRRYSSELSADGKMRVWTVYDARGLVVSRAYCAVGSSEIVNDVSSFQ